MTDLKIVYRDPASLRGYDKNARAHSAEQVAQIRRSIDAYTFTNPVLLRDDGVTIGAGHGRVEAALLAPPLKRVPTIVIPGLSEEEWRAYVIADNRIALGSSWNEDLLRSELLDLRGVGFDISLTGFDTDEISTLFATVPRHRGLDTIPPIPAVPISRPRDIWVLGDHRIICGDATQAGVVARLIGNEKAEICVTDPPYGIGYGYANHDDRDNDANAQLVAQVFEHSPATKVWTPGPLNLARDISRFGASRVLAWNKGWSRGQSGLGGAATWEPVLVINPVRKKLPNTYFEFKIEQVTIGGERLRGLHPCPKPVALFAHLIEAFATARGIVYEPFSGSGTTIIACHTTGRQCRAVEIDPAYVDVAVRRWCEFSGQDAFLDDGRSFAEVAADRLADEDAVG